VSQFVTKRCRGCCQCCRVWQLTARGWRGCCVMEHHRCLAWSLSAPTMPRSCLSCWLDVVRSGRAPRWECVVAEQSANAHHWVASYFIRSRHRAYVNCLTTHAVVLFVPVVLVSCLSCPCGASDSAGELTALSQTT